MVDDRAFDDNDVDHWLTTSNQKLAAELTGLLDLDLGLREATLDTEQHRFGAQLSNVVDADKGLAAIVSVPSPDPSVPLRPTIVEVETTVRLIAPDSTALRVDASLRYDPADPYALHVLFHAASPGGEAVTWSFARELMVAGLDEPAGIGDVRMWPWNTPRGDFVAMALSSPDGNALFEVPRSALVRFLRRTYVVVPRGREADHMTDPSDHIIQCVQDVEVEEAEKDWLAADSEDPTSDRGYGSQSWARVPRQGPDSRWRH
jgi:hypothetical protein